MHRTIAFDLSRLYMGGAGATPRGIDRVEMSFARRLFDDPARHDVGLVPTLSRMGVLPAAKAGRLAALVDRHWRESQPPGGDARYAALRARLAGGPAPEGGAGSGASGARLGPRARHIGAMLWQSRWTGLRSAARSVPRDAVYVNTGQVLLGAPWPFRWLEQRPDVKAVFMIHDVIPIRYPEYAGPYLMRRHVRAIETAARYATAMLATSHAAADEIRRELGRFGRGEIPFCVAPLPVSASLLAGGEPPDLGPTRPYFVTVGVIDQRKNHRLLLHVWREFVCAQGGSAPMLVIAGGRGMRTGGVIDLIERSPGLRDAVVVASGLSSPALRDVIRGARALLMPSFAEGFGLPVVEALALGVPVIASDIPAHREVGGSAATYLDPLDGPGWRREILARAGEDPALGRRTTVAPRPPQTWTSYFDEVLPFLDTL